MERGGTEMKSGSRLNAERIFICQYQMKNLQWNHLWAASKPKQYLGKSNLIVVPQLSTEGEMSGHGSSAESLFKEEV